MVVLMPRRPSPVPTSPIESPCVRNCCLNTEDVCLGCGRTLDDIRNWTSYTVVQREQALTRARQRAAAFSHHLLK